jgi:hypothetical protein
MPIDSQKKNDFRHKPEITETTDENALQCRMDFWGKKNEGKNI